MTLTKEQIIEKLQQGEKVSPEQYYPAFYPDIHNYIEIKKNTASYRIDDNDWEDLELEVLQGLIYAVDHYDHKKNSDFDLWSKKIIKQFFDHEQNKILKKRIKEQEALEKLAAAQTKNNFPTEEQKLSHIESIRNLVYKKKTRNPVQTKLALDLYLHYFGYYGPFDRELEDASSVPKSLEDLINYYQIKDKSKIASLITSIQRIVIDNDYRKLEEMSLLKRVPLTPLDYKVLEFIIEQNKKTDYNGKPVCPNSTDFIKKGRFEFEIRSRTTLSDSIRRLKDAGYRFAEQKDRNSHQGYFLLNPEIYESLSINECVAAVYLENLIANQPDGPVKSGISLLFDRITKDYNYNPESLQSVVQINSLLPVNTADSIIFEDLCNAARNRTPVTLTCRTTSGLVIHSGRIINIVLNSSGHWKVLMETSGGAIELDFTDILKS